MPKPVEGQVWPLVPIRTEKVLKDVEDRVMKIAKLSVCLAFVLTLVGYGLYRSVNARGSEVAVNLPAPTGVNATDNLYNNKVGVYWEPIFGATTYRIFRNISNDTASASEIGTTQASSFFDASAAPNQSYFYWVRAENSSTVSSMSAPDSGSRTNTQQQGPVGPLNPPPVPPGNPVTAAKAYLGKTLFWDEQLSSTKTVSCGTCHSPGNGGTDKRSVTASALSLNPGPDGFLSTSDDVRGSMGVPFNDTDGTYEFNSPYGLHEQVTPRRAMSFVDAAYSPVLFWDGRATGNFRDPITNDVIINNGASLESQILGPPVSSAEMAHGSRTWTDVAEHVASSRPLALSPSIPAGLAAWISGRTYQDLFLAAFGSSDINAGRIAMAIATYERTLYSDQTPLDQANAGIGSLTQAENRGRGVFAAPGNGCVICHGGTLTTDNLFHYDGVRPQNEDTGRFQVTGDTNDLGEFRTPSLRNVELRGSYFHNGRFTTLEEVIAFYNRGGDFNAANKPAAIRPLNLNAQQQADLVAFLKRPFTDPRVAAELPPFDRPVLYSESARVPQIIGVGRAGANGITPQIKAISPPLAGNPNFIVSVYGVPGNASAVLVIDENDPGEGTVIPASGSLARVAATTQTSGSGDGWSSLSIQIPDSPLVVGKTYFARWYINDAASANGFSVSQAAKFTIFAPTSVNSKAKFDDFDGDGKTDISVFRPSEGVWFILRSNNDTFQAEQFGIASDKLVPADYDGDGRTDVAVFRDGEWYLDRSRDGFLAFNFGLSGDIPQPGDYDGDGITDLAVFRPSDGTWYLQQSRDGFSAIQFGIASDRPAAADFDGDGKTDPTVYRGGVWYSLQSADGFRAVQFGLASDKPVLGDYDGDGKADTAVWRPADGTWYILNSTDGSFHAANFGLPTDIPTPGDFNGDGSNEHAVFRPSSGTWFISDPGSGYFRASQFGISTDKPVPSSIIQ